MAQGEQQQEAQPQQQQHQPAEPPHQPYFMVLPIRTLTDFVPEEHLNRLALYLGIYAVLFIIAGLIGIIFPLVFALAVETLIAWILIAGGVISLAQFIMVCGAPGTTSFLLLGILHTGVGVLMLIKPFEAGMIMIYILAGWFLGHGILKSLMACQVRSMTSWPAVLASGILSVILAFAILALAPRYGLVLLGIIFGADMLASGLAMLITAAVAYCAVRSVPSERISLLDEEAQSHA